jgi:hypothetical protein
MIIVILIAIVVLGAAIWYNRLPATIKTEALNVAPVDELPQPIKCGCGRSPSGICVGLHKLSKEEWDFQQALITPVKKEKTTNKSKTEKSEVLEIAEDKVEAKIKKPRAPRKSKSSNSTQV